MAKEFDFDELDKAVNSLMKDTEPETPAPSVPSVVEPVAVPPAPSPAIEPIAPVTPIEPPVSVEVPSPVSPTPMPAPAAAPKPTGRFMDVVHPSSDMRTANQPTSREGVALSPITSTTSSAEVSEPAVAPAAPIEPEINTDSVTLPPAPLTSPFLPDAQVEKRPLGSPASDTSSTVSLNEAIAAELNGENEPATPEVTEPPVATESEQTPPVEVPAPEEPTSESNTSTTEEPAPEKETIGLPEELNKDLVAIESGEVQSDSEEKTEAAPAPAAALLSQSSIPQQYQEEASSTTETHAPIYDDQTTAHTAVQPAKKSNKMHILLIAIVAVAIGIAGAVGLYFLQFSR